MIAYLATKYDTAQINDGMADYIRRKLGVVLKENIEYKNLTTINEIVSTRIPISIQKYAKAIACSKLKTVVDIEDIDEAFEYISYKLHFLANIDFSSTSETLTTKVKTKDIIKLKIIELCDNQELSVNEISDSINNSLDKPVSPKSISRYLEEMALEGTAKKIKFGKWVIVKPE